MLEFHVPTPVTIVSVTPRREMHGEEKTPALSLGIRYKGPNTVLDALDAGLTSMLYMGVDSHNSGQLEIEEARVSHLPKLRSAALGSIAIKGEFVGWKLVVKYGIDDTTSVVLVDCKLDKVRVVEICEGGTVELRFRIGTSKVDERMVGQLAMLMDQEVPVLLSGPKVAGAAIDGSVEAFKRDHPDAGAPAAPPAQAPERGENWPFPTGNDAPPPPGVSGETQPAASETKAPAAKPKAAAGGTTGGKGGTKGGKRAPATTPDATDAFIAAHAGPVQ